jgi:hypothetical protein
MPMWMSMILLHQRFEKMREVVLQYILILKSLKNI